MIRIALHFFLGFTALQTLATTGAVTGGYHIDSGANATITAHSVTKKVTNSHASGLTIYIPLNSATEWSTYVANPPAGVLVENVATCGGVSVGGYCWYLSAPSASCDSTCSAHGGYNEATRTFAGDQGANANCASVLDALLGSSAAVVDLWMCSNGAIGCTNLSADRWRCMNAATTSSSSWTNIKRACACNN